MDFQRTNGHSVSRLTAHIVWVTKYRYPVLEGDIKMRCRTLLIQICEAEDIQILKGVDQKIIFTCILSIDHLKILAQ